MIKVYKGVGPNVNRRLGQVCDWLDHYKLDYVLITKKDLNEEIIKQMLLVSEGGFDEILVSFNTMSRDYQKMREMFDYKMITTREMIQVILEFPIFLKSPIVFDERKLLVGFSSDEIRKFLPRERKKRFIPNS